MGQKAQTGARINDRVERGTVVLETDFLLFRSARLDPGSGHAAIRLRIPFKEIKKLEARDGWLELKYGKQSVGFELGSRAKKWAEKIRSPRSLLDKLGVKPDSRVSVLGVRDENFLKQLRERTSAMASGEKATDCDFVFFAAESREDLVQLKSLVSALKKTGAAWVVYPKGQEQITENDVLAAGKAAALVDVKVCGFSATHTALKFVIPVARR